MQVMRQLGKFLVIFAAVLSISLAFSTPADAAKKHHKSHKHRQVSCKIVKHGKPRTACKTKPHQTSAKRELVQLADTDLAAGPMTKVIEIATPYIGLHARSDRTQLIKLMDGVDPVRTAWCVGFANSMMLRAGMEPLDSLAVASYLSWGVPVKEPRVGDIVILNFKKRRGSQSHLGFLYGITTENGRTIVQVLGGNQRKQVTISNYNVNNVVTIRRAEP